MAEDLKSGLPCQRSERDLDSNGLPNCNSSPLTTRPRCLMMMMVMMKFISLLETRQEFQCFLLHQAINSLLTPIRFQAHFIRLICCMFIDEGRFSNHPFTTIGTKIRLKLRESRTRTHPRLYSSIFPQYFPFGIP